MGEPVFEKRMMKHLLGLLSLGAMITSMADLGLSLQAFYNEHMMWAYAWALASWCIAWIAWMIKPNA